MLNSLTLLLLELTIVFEVVKVAVVEVELLQLSMLNKGSVFGYAHPNKRLELVAVVVVFLGIGTSLNRILPQIASEREKDRPDKFSSEHPTPVVVDNKRSSV